MLEIGEVNGRDQLFFNSTLVDRSSYSIEGAEGNKIVRVTEDKLANELLSISINQMVGIYSLIVSCPKYFRRFNGFYLKEIVLQEGYLYMVYILDVSNWIYPWSPAQQAIAMKKGIANNLNLSRIEWIDWNDSFGYEDLTYFRTRIDPSISIFSPFFDILTDVEVIQQSIIEKFTYNYTMSSEDIDEVLDCVWVLESDSGSAQGTGFMLEGVGLVTCSHCVYDDVVVFKPSRTNRRYRVEVIANDEISDIAVLRIIDPPENIQHLNANNHMEITRHTPIRVVGFPNYRVGDSGYVVDGKVAGFRTISSIRRFLTTCPIVAGNSGGPILNFNNDVIGIAATGADDFQSSHETEKHGGIPISVLYQMMNLATE